MNRMRWALASAVAVALLGGCAPVAAGSDGASPDEGLDAALTVLGL
ncbi:MAG TPA: hypothetical protein VGO65_11340 [Pseudolysinimonas sp.]|jgi:hypothetical protein|nr:hypothetical protein [Pseudolysinimonas sp.]